MMRAWMAMGLLAAAAAGQEAKLAWKSGPAVDYEAQRITLAPAPPQGVKPLPAKGVRYGRLSLAGAPVLVAVDRTRAWLDRNGDGALTDEKPVPLHDGKARIEFGDLVVRIESTPAGLAATPLGHREGAAVLEGRVRAVALYDGGRIFVDLDGNRVLEAHERVRPGEPFRLRSKGYVARIADPSGARIVFEQVTTAPPVVVRDLRVEPIDPLGRKAPGGEASLRELRRRLDLIRKSERRTQSPLPFKTSRSFLYREAGELGTKAAFRFLRKAYEEETTDEVKAAVVDAMGYADYVKYEKEVVKIAESTTGVVRAAALRALHFMGAPGRARVCRAALQDGKSEEVWAAAADGYASSDDEDSIQELLRWAAGNGKIGYHCYRAATRHDTPPGADVARAARSPYIPLRALGVRHAWAMGLPEARALALESVRWARVDDDLRLAVIEVLASLSDPEAVTALLTLAPRARPEALGRTIDLLGPVRDPAAVDTLVDGLVSKELESRILAADVLAELPDERIAAAVTARLELEEEAEVQAALIRAAGRHKAVMAVARIALLGGHGGETVRHAALRALSRIGFAHAAVTRFFTEAAKNAAWEELLIVLDEAAAGGDPKAAPLLLEHLDHEQWQIRLAAVQGLARVRVKAAVAPLIARLRGEETVRLKRAIGLALYRITGQQFFDLVDLWEKWWAGNAATFRVPETPPHLRGAKHKTFATFYGLPVDSNRVVFVLDRSGSMSNRGSEGRGPTDWKRAVEETLKVVAALPSGARANVILFDHEVVKWRRALAPVRQAERSKLANYLRSKKPRGGTNLYDALEAALGIVGADTIYMLSDGEPTGGRFTRTPDILREVKTLNRTRRITIHCVALGSDAALLRALSRQNSGAYTVR